MRCKLHRHAFLQQAEEPYQAWPTMLKVLGQWMVTEGFRAG